MINYTLPPNLLSRQWEITLSSIKNNKLSTEISLPNWVPGSCLIRNFPRHITEIRAFCDGTPVELAQIDKDAWHTAAISGKWRICYIVYALDLSVHDAFLTTEWGFFDGTCIFLKVKGHEHEAHRMTLSQLPEHWRITTTLPTVEEHAFQAVSHMDLIDHPIELGNIEFLSFEATGIPHRIALNGFYHPLDRDRLVSDIRKVYETKLAAFPSPAPFNQYLLLLHVSDNIYGGLERVDSTALLADRNSLPPFEMGTANSIYTQLLGLFSHGYFHAWNVRSIRPGVFIPYHPDRENYTEQLWAFEGITFYYGDLFLAQSDCTLPETYLNLLAQGITRV